MVSVETNKKIPLDRIVPVLSFFFFFCSLNSFEMNHEKLCNECSNDTLYRNERFDDGITIYDRIPISNI